ncbi:hypothetical protein Cpin_4425 [Chitinophaga pinensis DSM 2588]|uniref:Uncharacterized protein n=1 Tax=Chitinophaga pinensis (strain ATCC 43595 / DSM 2588 / LMG 13176 / NBRC 15968 / NCIMB 11800 / UQM 2034) TaxID=485918 RepID=A0A979G6P1_CHIPD|nr:hypothetical protein Cpin_4425 [Chitinophaga pinensis DSM 2588]
MLTQPVCRGNKRGLKVAIIGRVRVCDRDRKTHPISINS